MGDEHPFAQYVRIVARGPGKARALTQPEARDAMRMIAHGLVEPVQLGAFLMMLRYRQETPAELAGFVEALRSEMILSKPPRVDLDWPSYAAGRTRGAPWYLVSALLLAENGVRILMHGPGGCSSAIARGLAALGMEACATPGIAARVVQSGNFAFLPLPAFSPVLSGLFDLRPLLGLRSAANSVARLLNPFGAPFLIQGVFHPGYRELQSDAARLLCQPGLAVFKGGGGEAERNPDKPCRILLSQDATTAVEEWLPAAPDGPSGESAEAGLDAVRACWQDDASASGRRTVIATAAVALRLLGHARSQNAAESLAEELWRRRFRRRLAAPRAAAAAS